MNPLVTGIHHVTAVASDAQKNIDFYSGILGLNLVKKTVNFDDPDVYHFYYGDQKGTPGTILTFFPYAGLKNGRHGKGMLNTTTFSVPAVSMNFWLERLKRFGVAYKKPQERFTDEVVVYFEDEDGLGLEFVFNDKDTRNANSAGHINAEYAIKGFYSVEIWLEGFERTAALLTEQMDHKPVAEKSNRFRFAAQDSPGNYIDLICMPESLKGLAGSGTVHHIAFATPDIKTQEEVRQKILQRLLNPTPVRDRKYFSSIYFREPGGVLFEVATSGPGFTVDEDEVHLGEVLQLPEQYQLERSAIEKKLIPVSFDRDKFQ